MNDLQIVRDYLATNRPTRFNMKRYWEENIDIYHESNTPCRLGHAALVPNTDGWLFLFSVFWPDDIDEAIARIDLVLTNNVPKEWSFDDRFANRLEYLVVQP